MKKFLSCFLFVFGLVMVCNLSYAATATFNVIEFDGTERVITHENSLTEDATYNWDLTPVVTNYPLGNSSFPTAYEYSILFSGKSYTIFCYDGSGTPVITELFKDPNYSRNISLFTVPDENFLEKDIIYGGTSNTSPSARVYYTLYTSVPTVVFSTTSVYSMTINTSPNLMGNRETLDGTIGEVIYGSGSTEEEVPSMTNPFTNAELVDMYNRLINSEDVKSLLPASYNKVFVTYNKWTNQYKAYFYPEQYKLKGSIYPEGTLDNDENVIDYKSYKIIAFDSDNFLWDVWQSINPFDYYTFIARDTNDFSFYEYVDSHDMNQMYFNVEDLPIVYTSHDLGFVLLNTENNTYEDDTVNSIPGTVLTDEETGEDIIYISPVVDKDTNDIWNLLNSFKNAILNGIKSIFVPSEDFISEKVNSIMYRLSFYTSLQETYESLISTMTSDSQGAPQITVDFGLSEDSVLANCGTASVLDFSWYAKFKPAVDLFIIAFVYGVFIWRFIVELPNTISGLSNAFDYEPMQVEDKNGDKHFAIRNRNTGNVRIRK